MKISIITVVYNNQRTIEEAIKSVLSQSYKNIEYIIIDGNSTDNTISIVRKYQEKISIIISEPDKGIYDAMNKGILTATGDIIGILNSDDLYNDENVIRDVMEVFLDNPELDIVYGNLAYVKSDDTKVVVRKWLSSDYYERFFEDGHVPPHPSLFLKSNVYQAARMFNLKYKLAADYEFMLRVFKLNDFKSFYLNKLIVRMRLGGATNKSFKNIVSGNKEILAAWKDNKLSVPSTLMMHRLLKRIKQFL